MLSDLLVPTPLTVANVGIQNLSSWPRVRISCITLHCPLLSLFSLSILLRAETRRQSVVVLSDVNWKYECPATQIFYTLCTSSFLKVYFTEFAITIVPFFPPLYSSLPYTHPAFSIPHTLAHVHELYI